ncbi:MAG: hypothetical protein KIS92_17255 [Planctomycetota bacterium]|nr:hypothetical protein [Planctomycetota bacterium]
MHALRFARARRITILGTPASWGFLNRRYGKISVEVLDAGAPDWLGLYAPGASLSDRAREVLAGAHKAVVYLASGREDAADALRKAGVREVLAVAPPLRADRGFPHAVWRLLDPLKELIGAEAVQRARAPALFEQAGDPLLAVSVDETRAALQRLGLAEAPAGGFFSLHPGSGGKTKCWPAERYARLAAEVCAASGETPLVFFGPADEAVRKAFEAAWPAGAGWLCAQDFPLREVAALLSISKRFVGNDAGVTHLAARCCPTYALFGPTDPCLWRPQGRASVICAPGIEMDQLPYEMVRTAVDLPLPPAPE